MCLIDRELGLRNDNSWVIATDPEKSWHMAWGCPEPALASKLTSLREEQALD